MYKAIIVITAILGLIGWISLWIWLFFYIPNISTNKKFLSLGSQLIQWRKRPSIVITGLQCTVIAFGLGSVYIVSRIDTNHWLYDFRGEIIGIAFTVLVLDRISHIRSRQEFKASIIQQLGSRSNEFALDAARIASSEHWLTDGSLRCINLSEANLKNAVLFNADLRGADLMVADLSEARLVKANLQAACLWGAKLQKASLRFAQLQGANLCEADLRDALLDNADLTGALFQHARYSFYTRWPKDFDYKTAGAILDLDSVAQQQTSIASLKVYNAMGWVSYDVHQVDATGAGIVVTVAVGAAEILELKEYPALLEWYHPFSSDVTVDDGKYTVFDIVHDPLPVLLRYRATTDVGNLLMVGLFRRPQAIMSS